MTTMEAPLGVTPATRRMLKPELIKEEMRNTVPGESRVLGLYTRESNLDRVVDLRLNDLGIYTKTVLTDGAKALGLGLRNQAAIMNENIQKEIHLGRQDGDQGY